MTNELEMNRLRHKILTMLPFEERMYIQPLLDKCLMFANGESRPHGEWKLDSVGAYCSECKVHPDYTSNFCPNCGAEMRKEAEND